MQNQVIIIGGGAAGFFSAIQHAEKYPSDKVVLLEKSNKLLAKVRVSGGGRCNVTHHCLDPRELSKFYPRGEKFLKKAFAHFAVDDTIQWFEKRSVPLKVESDYRMFPTTDDSETIASCLMRAAHASGVEIKMNQHVSDICVNHDGFDVFIGDDKMKADKLIITTGGSPKLSGFNWLQRLGLDVVPPVPSLFTFNLKNHSITKLMGLSVGNAQVKIQGTKLISNGALLITHWGMSGPAVLRLSAFGARVLAEKQYAFNYQVNWLGGEKEHELRERLNTLIPDIGKRQIANRNPFELPNRLWEYFLTELEIPYDTLWHSLSKKHLNRLINKLLNDDYAAKGKTTFKEEFVTAGGISLAQIDTATMAVKSLPNLHFAGEVLDIDGVTGGFNFQAAWTTGFIAGSAPVVR